MEGAPDRSQEPGLLHPSLVKTLLRRAFFPIYIMGKRLDEIMANLRSGFDTLCSRIHWNGQSDPGDSGGIKPGPSVVYQLLSPSCQGLCGSHSIRCWEAEAVPRSFLTLQFRAGSSFGACV